MEINRVMLLGNLTQDPETRYLPSGTAVSKLRLASSRRFKDKSGESREETLFINVEAWGRTGELCQEYLRKGSEALVEGRLKMDTYQAQDGQNRTVYVIVADRVQFGRRPQQGGPGGPGQGGFGDDYGDSGGGQGFGSPADRPSAAPPAQESYGYGGQRQPPRGPANAGGFGGPSQRPPAPPPPPRQAPAQSQAPTWQSSPPAGGGDYPADSIPPADDFNDTSGGTNNDLPF